MYIYNIRTFVQERKVLQMQNNNVCKQFVNSFVFIFVKVIQNPFKQLQCHNKDALNSKEPFPFQPECTANKQTKFKRYSTVTIQPAF